MGNEGKDAGSGNFIINRPSAITKKRRYGEKTLTAMFWSLWALWLRPVMMLALWAFGFRMFMTEIAYEKIGIDGRFFVRYLFVIVIIYSLLQLWNRYNYLHFHGRERRKAMKDVADAEMAEFYRVSEDAVKKIKNMKQLSVRVLEGGNIVFGTGGAGIASAVGTGNFNGA